MYVTISLTCRDQQFDQGQYAQNFVLAQLSTDFEHFRLLNYAHKAGIYRLHGFHALSYGTSRYERQNQEVASLRNRPQ